MVIIFKLLYGLLNGYFSYCIFFLVLLAVAAKAPRKNFGGSSGGASSVYNSSPSSNNSNFGLCNHAKMWPTPNWQKGMLIN